MLAFVSVHRFFVLFSAAWRVVVLHFVLIGTTDCVDQVVFPSRLVTGNLPDDDLALVFVVSVPLDQAVWLFLLAEELDFQLLVVHDFVAVGTQLEQFLAVEVQGGRPGVRDFELLASDLDFVFVVLDGVDVGIRTCFEVFLDVDDAVPGFFVVEVPVDFVEVFVLEHVEEVVAVVEDRDDFLVGRVVHIEARAGRGFDEEVLVLVVAVAAFDEDPAVVAAALVLVLVLEVGHVVRPDVLLLGALLLRARLALGLLLLAEGRALVVGLLLHLEVLHLLVALRVRLVVGVVLVGELDPGVDLGGAAVVLLAQPAGAVHERGVARGDGFGRVAVDAVGLVAVADEDGDKQDAHVEAVTLLPAEHARRRGDVLGQLVRRVERLVVDQLRDVLRTRVPVLELRHRGEGRPDRRAHELRVVALVQRRQQHLADVAFVVLLALKRYVVQQLLDFLVFFVRALQTVVLVWVILQFFTSHCFVNYIFFLIFFINIKDIENLFL